VLMEQIRETISASEGARSMSRVRREGMESVRRRGSMSREEDWVRARVSPGTFTSIRRRPESSFVHDQSRVAFVLISWGRRGLDEEFFMIPRRPGKEFDDFPLDLGSVEVVPLISDISWMRDVLPLVLEVAFPIVMPGIEVDMDAGGTVAPVKAAMVDAGR